MAQLLAAGTMLGPYRIEEAVGSGAVGTVYRATHTPSGAVVAVKVLLPEAAANATTVRRFRREARASMAVQHPSIVRILEVLEHEGVPVLAMEYLEGRTLGQLLESRAALALPELAPLLLPVTSAIGTAHSLGIVHRDLKPDNILLCDRRTGIEVKVLDFGVAKLTATEGAAVESVALTRQGMLMGTPFYMSPEQALGQGAIDHRADIWSLGIILYQCLTGVLPTFGRSLGEVFRKVVAIPIPPIGQLCSALAPDFAALVTRMLQRNREERPWDLREVHGALEHHAGASSPHFGQATAPSGDDDPTVA